MLKNKASKYNLIVTFFSIFSFLILLVLFSDINRNDWLNFRQLATWQFQKTYGQLLGLFFLGNFLIIPVTRFFYLKYVEQQKLRQISLQIGKFFIFYTIWFAILISLVQFTDFYFLTNTNICGSSYCDNYRNYMVQIAYFSLLIIGNWLLALDVKTHGFTRLQ